MMRSVNYHLGKMFVLSFSLIRYEGLIIGYTLISFSGLPPFLPRSVMLKLDGCSGGSVYRTGWSG
jgi:hypothetical protein